MAIFYRVTHGQPVTVRPPVIVSVTGAIVNSTATTGATSIAWSYDPSLFDVDAPTMDAIAQLWSQVSE